MHVFLDTQRRERYRAFIVHGPPNKGKSSFARKLAKITGGAYIDVLETVAKSPELAAQVDILDAGFLKGLALEVAEEGTSVILVDEFDFLIPIWAGDLSLLTEVVRKLSVTETQAIIGFVMQTVGALEDLTLKNSVGQSRNLRLDEIRGLK
jgi:hypothetical protein